MNSDWQLCSGKRQPKSGGPTSAPHDRDGRRAMAEVEANEAETAETAETKLGG